MSLGSTKIGSGKTNSHADCSTGACRVGASLPSSRPAGRSHRCAQTLPGRSRVKTRCGRAWEPSLHRSVVGYALVLRQVGLGCVLAPVSLGCHLPVSPSGGTHPPGFLTQRHLVEHARQAEGLKPWVESLGRAWALEPWVELRGKAWVLEPWVELRGNAWVLEPCMGKAWVLEPWAELRGNAWVLEPWVGKAWVLEPWAEPRGRAWIRAALSGTCGIALGGASGQGLGTAASFSITASAAGALGTSALGFSRGAFLPAAALLAVGVADSAGSPILAFARAMIP